MPFVNVKVMKEKTILEQKMKIIEGLTDLIVKIMKRDRNLTVVTVDELSSDQWAVGGKLIKEFPSERIMTFVNIKVSKGTTNQSEAREMMIGAKKLMHAVFGNSDECNYFIIDELNPDLWGFDGISMTDQRSLEI